MIGSAMGVPNWTIRRALLIAAAFAPLLWGCSAMPARVNPDGSPQRDYVYQVPEITDDGWTTAPLVDAGVDPKPIKTFVSQILDGSLENIHGVVVAKDGDLILEEYFYGYDRDKKHMLASVTKSITSLLIGIAIDRNMIGGVDQGLYHFFPEYADPAQETAKREITLAHALTMTAGLQWNEYRPPHPHPRNSNTQMYGVPHPIEYVLGKKLSDGPGERWNYNSGLTVVLGGVLHRASGLHPDAFAERHLFGPLGITDAYWYRHSDGTVFVNGDLLLRPRDAAKIGQLLLTGGEWQGRQIVSSKWIEESTTPRVSAIRGRRYGYQWHRTEVAVNDKLVDVIFASGTGGQKIFCVPAFALVVVFTSQVFDNRDGHQRTDLILSNYILPAMMPPSPPRSSVELDASVVEKYAGRYRYDGEVLGDSHVVRMELDDGRLFIRPTAMSRVELHAENETRLYGSWKPIGNFQIDLTIGEQGLPVYGDIRFGIEKRRYLRIE